MQKIVKLNRAFLYCCMVVMFCLYYKGYAAPTQGKPVSLTIKNSTLADVLRQVSKKSGLYIYFQDVDLAAHKNVTIDVRNKPVESVLHELLDGRGFSWVEVSENTIAVKKKPITEERVDGDTVATITVTGKVVDEKGAPVIGATVVVKGGKIGTTTNSTGIFALKGVRMNALLIISNISFLTSEVPVKGTGAMGDIKLRQYVGELDETVVIAYGTTTRRLSTGNTYTIRAKDIEKQPVGNPLLALQGRVPGLVIEQSSGMPGSPIKVRIQGQNSIGSGNSPLFVVDGIPYVSQTYLGNPENILGSSFDATNTLSWLNPNDIESIDVLKDADATSIYGSRAANGAILITTKKGQIGKTKLSVNAQTGFAQITRKVDLLDTQEYLQLRSEAYGNDGQPLPTNPDPSNYDLTVWDKNRSTDWQKELIGHTATYSNFQTSYSGGNINTQFLIAANYRRETTVMPGRLSDKKTSLHFNINNISSNKKFNINLSGSYLIDNNKLPGGDLTSAATSLPPNAPSIYNQDGSLNWEPINSGLGTTATWENPMASFSNSIRMKTKNLISNANLSYEVVPGISIKTSLGYTNQQLNETSLFPLRYVNPNNLSFSQDRSKFGNNNSSSWIIEPQVIYKRALGKGNLDVLIGTTISRNEADYQKIEATGFSSELLIEDIKSATSLRVLDNGEAVYRYAAVFGRINYNLRDKYIVNLTARRDGSSRFGAENQFHNFGSIAGSWLFHNENSIKDLLPFISYGKLRLSYGITGNDQIGDYTFLNLYSSTSLARPYQGIIGLATNSLYNPFLQWEETRKIQGGIDLGFLNDRILLNLNYFRNRSSNQLLGYDLPYSTGFGNIMTNFPAKVQNSGIELSINTVNFRTNSFNWSTIVNLTIPRNKLLKFEGLENSSYSNSLFVGEPISGIVKTYQSSGVNPQTGLYEFYDKDGKRTSDVGFGDENKIHLINTNPKFYGGVQNDLTFKGFELSFFFQYVNQVSLSDLYSRFPGYGAQNQPKETLNRWQKEGDLAPYQKLTRSDFMVLIPAFYQVSSDAAYVNGSYLRLKNLSFSWTLPKPWLTSTHIDNFKLYIQGQNLFVLTKYPVTDPETRSLNTLSPLRTIVVGVIASL